MSKRLLFVLCCTLLLATLTFGTTAQQHSCVIDFNLIQHVLTNAFAAYEEGNIRDALGFLAEVRTIVESTEAACEGAGGLNWCYPGQPWGDGRCNGHDLSPQQVDWFWTCGMYWAEHEAGLLEFVPEWCGHNGGRPDTDGDGAADGSDQCPADPNKAAPGICGCGVPDGDSDGDFTPDCFDGCPSDPAKLDAGVCGCGVSDADTNGDGLPDCTDLCPADPGKASPGICGCGVADTDTDSDGTPDCFDQCSTDPAKIAPGACGCGNTDTDTDGDGTPDCYDLCPTDSNKIAPDVCACGKTNFQVGMLCWDFMVGVGQYCAQVLSVTDFGNDGCMDVSSMTGTSGCTASTPYCMQ